MISQTWRPQILLSITGLKWFGIFIEYTLVHMEVEPSARQGDTGRLSNSGCSLKNLLPPLLASASTLSMAQVRRAILQFALLSNIWHIICSKTDKDGPYPKKRCYALALGFTFLNQVLLFPINRTENTLGENTEDEIYIFWSYRGVRHPLTLQTASNSLAVSREDKHRRIWLFNLLTKARCWQESWIPDPVFNGCLL